MKIQLLKVFRIFLSTLLIINFHMPELKSMEGEVLESAVGKAGTEAVETSSKVFEGTVSSLRELGTADIPLAQLDSKFDSAFSKALTAAEGSGDKALVNGLLEQKAALKASYVDAEGVRAEAMTNYAKSPAVTKFQNVENATAEFKKLGVPTEVEGKSSAFVKTGAAEPKGAALKTQEQMQSVYKDRAEIEKIPEGKRTAGQQGKLDAANKQIKDYEAAGGKPPSSVSSFIKQKGMSLTTALVGAIGLGFAFSLPNIIQAEITGAIKNQNLVNSMNQGIQFGGVWMAIPDTLINSSSPELSPFLYMQIDSKTHGFMKDGHYYVAKDPGTWAQTWAASPQFPGIMIDLITGYQFTMDGLSHGRPLLPLAGHNPNQYGDPTISDFLSTFLSKLKLGKMPMFGSGIEAPSETDAPKGADDHWKNIIHGMTVAAQQLKTTVPFGTWKIKPFVPRDLNAKPGTGYQTDANLPAMGIYMYQCEDTPLVRNARLAGNVNAFDYIVVMDAYGNLIPAHTIKDAKSRAFVPNTDIASIYSLVNNQVYKPDGSVWQPQSILSFDDYGSTLQTWDVQFSSQTTASGKGVLKGQVQAMAKVCVQGPFTPLKLALYYTDDALISSLVTPNTQVTPIYTSQTTLGVDSSGAPIIDYFVAVNLVNGALVPVNIMQTQPMYLISLVTSRIYTPQGDLATVKVKPTDQVADQVLPTIQQALSDRSQLGLPSLDTVDLGQKYMPGALNPYGLPFPPDYFTIIYANSTNAFGISQSLYKQLTDAIGTSRRAWGSPYKSELNSYRDLTTQLQAEQKKAQPDKTKIASLQKQLADINKTISTTESQLGSKAQSCQFTKTLLFNIYFKVPNIAWVHNGNYFYQSVAGTANTVNTFAPGEYFVMSDTSDPKSLTDNIGLECDPTTLIYAISLTNGYVYDTTGNKVTDSSGKVIMFDVNALLTRVQANQVKAGGFAFMQNNKPLNDMATSILASMQAYNASFQQDLGPLSFYVFQLTVPDSFVAAFKNGQYVYQATAQQVPNYKDFVICVEETIDGKKNFGVKFSDATTSVVSLVTGMIYNRSGIAGQYDVNQLYQLISAQYQTISQQVQKQIQKSAADFQGLIASQAPPVPQLPQMPASLISQINAQQDVPAHPSLRQDPATGNYYQVSAAYKTIIDFNAPESAIKLLYPNEVTSGAYKARNGNVGIIYNDQGQYVQQLTGWALQGVRLQAGIQVTAGGEQLIPSNIPPLPLLPQDKNITAGQSGQGLIISTDSKFPTPNISSIQDPTDRGTTYYFYYLSQGSINSQTVPMDTYLVRQVNTSKGVDRYIDMITGYAFKPDGSIVIGQSEAATDSLGQSMIVNRQAGDVQSVSIGGTLFTVWDSQKAKDGSTVYSLNDPNFNSLQLVAMQSKPGTWMYNAALDVPDAQVSVDSSGNPTQIYILNQTYTLQSSGAQTWKDTTSTLSVKVDSSSGQPVYLVTFLKIPIINQSVVTQQATDDTSLYDDSDLIDFSDVSFDDSSDDSTDPSSGTMSSTPNQSSGSPISTAPSTSSSSSSTPPASAPIGSNVKIVDTFTSTAGYRLTNTVTGVGILLVMSANAPQTVMFDTLTYTFKQQGKTSSEFIMYNSDQNKQIRLVMASTGVTIYTDDNTKYEYAYDAEGISTAALTNYVQTIWQLRPAVDVYGNNLLVAPFKASMLQQVQQSDLYVATQDQDLYNKAKFSGVFVMPTIYYDGVNGRYLYQFTDADSSMPYYNSDYKGWYIDLRSGIAFDSTGMPTGVSFPIDTLSKLVNKLNVAIAPDGTGTMRVRFVPGGALQSTKTK